MELDSENQYGAGNQQGSRLLNQQTDPSETTRRAPYLTTSLAVLLGLLFTDGCVSPKGDSWRIYFAVTSKPLADIFVKSLEESFGLPSDLIRYGMTKDGSYRRVLNSMSVGSYLTHHFGTFKTLACEDVYPATHLPVQNLIQSGSAADFLRAAFSCDGGVSFYVARRQKSIGETKWLIRTVFLSCVHPNLRKEYRTLLSSLGVIAREVAKDGKLKIESKQGILKFYARVGFLPGVNAAGDSRFWKGVGKQEILRLVVESYSDPSKFYSLAKFNRVKVMI